MTRILRIAFLQADFPEGDRARNKSQVRKAATEAKKGGAAVLALPELWASGYDLPRAVAETWGAEEFTFVADLSREFDLAILGGSLLEPVGGRYANTAVAYEGGEERQRYRKLHLFKPLSEDRYLQPGDDRPHGFAFAGVQCAMTVCYDLRFPEVYRPGAVEGVELFYVPAQWPRPRIHHWQALLVARAIENQCYVLGVNRLGRFCDVEFAGNSRLVGPGGEVLVDAGEKEGLFFGEVDPTQVATVREKLPVLEDRRSDLWRAET